MKKTIYVSFDIEASSHQEATVKLDSIFKQIEYIAPPLAGVTEITKTRKFLNKVRI